MKKNWFWFLYLIIFVNFALGRLLLLIHPESPLRNYHVILLPFGTRYSVLYTIDILGAMATALSIIPVFKFGFQSKAVHQKFWQGIFVLRILGDVAGHGYEWKLIQSCFYIDFWAGLSCLGMLILPLIPSYNAHFHYIYQPRKN